MNIDFNEIIDRKNTNSVKYDFAKEHGKPEDILPLWVADMDFKAPQEVLTALSACVQHGVFGYSATTDAYFAAVQGWYTTHFGWTPQREWLVPTPGVVFALSMALRAFTAPGDAVIIQQPVYHPFRNMIVQNGRTPVSSALLYENGAYHIDFEDFEAKLIQHRVKLFILCSPHNPVGRVWTQDELTRLGDLCVKHHVLVVADEIHADFVYEGYRHLVFAGLKPAYLERTITCTAPSKTFNLAGLHTSNIFIANAELRRLFGAEAAKTGGDELTTTGIVACQAAYEHGAPWLAELKKYLAQNLAFVRDFLAQRLPEIKLVEPQGTYLLWLDFNGLGLAPAALEELITNKAKLWLNDGSMFGAEGTGFERVNIACPQKTLEQAFLQLERAIRS